MRALAKNVLVFLGLNVVVLCGCTKSSTDPLSGPIGIDMGNLGSNAVEYPTIDFNAQGYGGESTIVTFYSFDPSLQCSGGGLGKYRSAVRVSDGEVFTHLGSGCVGANTEVQESEISHVLYNHRYILYSGNVYEKLEVPSGEDLSAFRHTIMLCRSVGATPIQGVDVVVSAEGADHHSPQATLVIGDGPISADFVRVRTVSSIALESIENGFKASGFKITFNNAQGALDARIDGIPLQIQMTCTGGI